MMHAGNSVENEDVAFLKGSIREQPEMARDNSQPKVKGEGG